VPEQLNEKVFDPDEFIIKVSLPEIAFDPLHAPDAVHEDALDDDHVIVISSPTEIELSELEILTLIDGGAADTPPPPPPPPPQEVKDIIEIKTKQRPNKFLGNMSFYKAYDAKLQVIKTHIKFLLGFYLFKYIQNN
tara:strand:- start:70 stop:477 length:408 start_codon:yes stop_codon:yes gene_type:complete